MLIICDVTTFLEFVIWLRITLLTDKNWFLVIFAIFTNWFLVIFAHPTKLVLKLFCNDVNAWEIELETLCAVVCKAVNCVCNSFISLASILESLVFILLLPVLRGFSFPVFSSA